jgi:hypothetical protein
MNVAELFLLVAVLSQLAFHVLGSLAFWKYVREKK